MTKVLEEATEEGIVVGSGYDDFDDDGRVKRTGTLVTASAHIITAVIGSGVLSLAWAIAQLGWVVGPIVLIAFSIITWFCSSLLVEFYRSPDPVKGKRNYTYMAVVRSNLGGWKFKLCGLAQYINLAGVTIGYTITTAISMAAVKRSNCFYRHGHQAMCNVSQNAYMIFYGVMQICLSQMPNFHKLWWLSILAAVMSVVYSMIGLGLALTKVISDGGSHPRTTLTGVTVGVDVSASEKVWRTFQALGNIAFAYSYSTVLIEIEDTLRSKPPENQVMSKASVIGVSTTTVFYMLCGLLGYAAFGNNAPGNFLTGFGFYDPYWLIDIANICIAVHLIGAYQLFCQPIYEFIESLVHQRFPDNWFLTKEYVVPVGNLSINFFRLTWRTAYVVLTTVIAMIFPFFNDFLGLIGALAFWPLTVYFPVEMYISRRKIRMFSSTWIWLQVLSMVCLVISLAAVAGSIEGIVHSLTA